MPRPETERGNPNREAVRRPWLGTKLALARAALGWERLWPALLPAGLLAGLFFTLAFLDVLPSLGGWPHAAVLGLLTGGFLWLLHRGLRPLSLPDAEAARRRLERDSGLRHRPLEALQDVPAGAADPEVQAYWQLHHRRLREQIRGLKVGWPRAGWSRSDHLGLRALVGLPLLVALIVAGGDWDRRLLRAAVPELILQTEVPPARLDVWISPPAYTGEAPVYLEPDRDPAASVRVPTGSKVLAQVQDGRGQPRLDLDGDQLAEFQARDDRLYRAEAEIRQGRLLTVQQSGLPVGAWTLQVVPDHPPSVEYLSAPSRAARGALQLEYELRDDYGVDSLTARLERLDETGAGEVIELPLALPSRSPREVEGRSYHDLTPHPWAGVPVTITLEARDAAGQVGRTESVETVLPERVFNHPVARALAELRRELTLHPERRRAVAQALDGLARQPDHYFNDIVVSLGLHSANQRLVHDRRAEAVPGVQALLWNLALHIEEGEVAVSERRLRELQQELQEALASDAPQEEIERLMSELQEALDQFLQSMAEQALRDFDDPQRFEDFPSGAEILERDDLQDLIDQAREMARAGDREQAQQLLAELQRMLENLQAQPMAQEESNQRLEQARQMMQDLQEVMEDQRDLLDRSFQRAQRGETGQETRGDQGEDRESSPGRAPGTEAGDAQAQESLRRELGDIMRRSGEMTGGIPRPLGDAEQAMRAAREALERGSPGQATRPQGEALDHLQRGMEAMLEDFAQQLGEGEGGEGNAFGSPGNRPRDPFGRQRGDGGYADRGEGVEVPDASGLQRAREILDELRRRSGQRGRPQIELDYLERLLRQF